MDVKDLLGRKRFGQELAAAEIRELVAGYVAGSVPDYQMAAFAMAVCCRGMTAAETAALTAAMRDSGASFEWPYPTADKHSTGGVGDKLSLVIQSVVAACGIKVPSLAGRGLGYTGGTIDKLETIPGYDCALDADGFRRTVDAAGLSIAMQTSDLCPADRRLYTLRDVTGTVASIPLITASILSKKLAEGAHTLVFDVKCGSGAFMAELSEARELARSLVDGATAAGRKAAALVTDMSAPLGLAVGNASEVAEALVILREYGAGSLPPALAEEAELSLELAALMVALEGECELAAAREQCRQALAAGAAWERFAAMVAAHGGDLAAFEAARAAAKCFRFRLSAPRGGYVRNIDALAVAKVAFALGAGRQVLGAAIDPWSGVELAVTRGERVMTGSPLATLVTSTRPEVLEEQARRLLSAFDLGGELPVVPPRILERVAAAATPETK